MRDNLGPYAPPHKYQASEEDQELSPGDLADGLGRLHAYTEKLHYIVNRRYTRKGAQKIDVGGPRNASNIIAPDPMWHLVHQSWELFDGIPHMYPTATSEEQLHQFILTIHEWVTGDTSASFETPLRHYQKVRNERDDCIRMLEKHETGVAAGQTTPAEMSAGARLERRLLALEDRLNHGSRIPSRELVSGQV
jgi:hypothetical protein